jgi:hypothetical protein
MHLRFTSFTLTLAIFLANACCMGASAAKPQAAVVKPDAHACCKAEKPAPPAKPEPPASQRCPCCDNVASILTHPAKDVKPALQLAPQHWLATITVASLTPASSLASPPLIDTSPPPAQGPPTLLRLHCASNT